LFRHRHHHLLWKTALRAEHGADRNVLADLSERRNCERSGEHLDGGKRFEWGPSENLGRRQSGGLLQVNFAWHIPPLVQRRPNHMWCGWNLGPATQHASPMATRQAPHPRSCISTAPALRQRAGSWIKNTDHRCDNLGTQVAPAGTDDCDGQRLGSRSLLIGEGNASDEQRKLQQR